MKINYQKEMESQIQSITKDGQVPTLLLHSCCAPCSSYVLEYLSRFFAITIYYYNPNIYPQEEYARRLEEQRQLIADLPVLHEVQLIEGIYDSAKFYQVVKGHESDAEGGERCFKCYELRLRQAALIGKERNFDFFTTTLSISPYKNADKLNEYGKMLADEYGIGYLCADFKKRDGYKRSIALSNQYQLYRQDYCGCIFSKNQRDAGVHAE